MVADLTKAQRQLLAFLFLDIVRSPVAFLPAVRVYKYAKEVLGMRKLLRLADFQRFERTYVRPSQILKESRNKRKKTLPYFVHGPDLLWQADLVDLHRPKGQKGSYAFVLTVIDVFTRRADAELVYDKSGAKVTKAFKEICRRQGIYPVRLQTDKGKEFFNSRFSKFCKDYNIRHFYVSSNFKAAVVERFNRQMQKLLTCIVELYLEIISRSCWRLLLLIITEYLISITVIVL